MIPARSKRSGLGVRPYLRMGIAGHTSLLVASGAAVQFLNFLGYPLLSRLYAPADFGILASVTAISTLLGAVICLRLDAVIQIAEPEDEVDILSAALIISAALACLIFAVGFGGTLTAGARSGGYSLLCGLPAPFVASVIPAMALMNGLFLLGRQDAAKRLSYRRISLAQITRALAGLGAQLALVAVLPGPAGLILGFSVGLVLATAMLWPFNVATILCLLARPAAARASLAVLKRYRGYISVDSVNVLISAAALLLYPVLILSLYGPSEAGFFAVASRLALIPGDVLGAAISTVYFQRLSQALRDGHGATRLYTRTLSTAVLAAAAIAVVLALTAKPFVALLFDMSWSRTSELVLFLLPMAGARFCTVCIGATPLAMKRPRISFIWNVVQLAIILGAAWACSGALESFLLASGLSLLGATAIYAAFLFRLTRRIACV